MYVVCTYVCCMNVYTHMLRPNKLQYACIIPTYVCMYVHIRIYVYTGGYAHRHTHSLTHTHSHTKGALPNE